MYGGGSGKVNTCRWYFILSGKCNCYQVGEERIMGKVYPGGKFNCIYWVLLTGGGSAIYHDTVDG